MKLGVSGASGKLGQKVLQFLTEQGSGHTIVGIRARRKPSLVELKDAAATTTNLVRWSALTRASTAC